MLYPGTPSSFLAGNVRYTVDEVEYIPSWRERLVSIQQVKAAKGLGAMPYAQENPSL
jgi:hypothetical protein